ncbi:MAG: hypothetical protein K6E63_00010 [Lachnospiraceae bacterium]|nr:hypothetical protein [Lachnospiraceae bacterium]
MRIFRKVLLAAGLIGALSTLGFVSQAKAAVTVSSSGTNNDTITLTEDATDFADGTYLVKVGSIPLASGTLSTGTASFSLKEKVNSNTAFSDGTISGTLDVTVTKGTETHTATSTIVSPLYKITAIAGGDTYSTGGTVKINSSAESSKVSVYAYSGETLTLSATAKSAFEFVSWSEGTGSVTVGTSAKEYTANFKRVLPDSFTFYVKSGSKQTDDEITVKKGAELKFNILTCTPGFTTIGDPTDYEILFDDDSYVTKKSKLTYSAKKKTDPSIYAYMRLYFGSKHIDSNNVIEITISGSSSGGSESKSVDYDGDRINTVDFVEYVTQGYTLEFTVKHADEDDIDSVKVLFPEGEDYVDSYDSESIKNHDDQRKVKIKFKDDKLEAGNNSATVKFRIQINDTDEYSPIDSDSSGEKTVTVYSNPTSSFSKTDYSLTYKLPSKVNTGNTSGKDSDSSTTTATAIKEVTGAYVKIGVDSAEATDAKKTGATGTLDEATLKKVLDDLKSKNKLTGDSHDVTLRLYPQGSSGYNNKIYTEVTEKVYKVVVRYTESASGSKTTTNSNSNSSDDGANSGRRTTTGAAYALPVAFMDPAANLVATANSTTAGNVKEVVLYRFEGQKITKADLGITGTFSTLSNGLQDVASTNGDIAIVVSSDRSKNTYTGVLGARSSSGGSASANDSSVGKWGQNNMPVYLMIAVVVATAVLGMTAYDRKRKNY